MSLPGLTRWRIRTHPSIAYATSTCLELTACPMRSSVRYQGGSENSLASLIAGGIGDGFDEATGVATTHLTDSLSEKLID